jgi:hypothetical protein
MGVVQYNPAKGLTKLRGLNTVITNLNKQIKEIKGGTLEGLIEAAGEIYQETERGEPITPVDTGALRASWFIYSQRGDESGNRKYKGPSTRSVSSKKKKKAHILKESRKEEMIGAKTLVGKADDIIVVAGYSVPYAAYVHEGIGGTGSITKWTRKGSGKWWFQRAVNSSSRKILGIIRKNAQIKK